MSGLGFVPYLGQYYDIALFILRLAFGTIFIAHALPKIKNLKANAEGFTMMGFKPGIFWGTIVAFGELLGGAAVILGLLTPIAGLYFSIEMLVATIWKLTNKQKLIGGYELDLILFTIGLLLLTGGGGVISLDVYWGIF